ncbi:hypothetical protein HKD37_10G027811 [Glycine soja]
MAGTGDNGGGVYHQLDGSQSLLLDAMTTQMQHFLNRNNEELYRRIEGLEHQMNPNVGRVNDGSNRIERQDRIEGVKLNVPSFKGRSDPDAYLDWEMKIQHAFSCNDYPKEQKVKLAAVTFSDYALVWWKKNQREMKREEGREIDTWTEMRRVMRKKKEEVLEPGDDPGHLRANVFQEGGNDENPKTAQIQGPMTRSKTKQSMDTLQQMVADILSKAQVEKDEAPEWRRTKPPSGEG